MLLAFSEHWLWPGAWSLTLVVWWAYLILTAILLSRLLIESWASRWSASSRGLGLALSFARGGPAVREADAHAGRRRLGRTPCSHLVRLAMRCAPERKKGSSEAVSEYQILPPEVYERTERPCMKAVWNGAVIAQSDATVMVEGNHYFPPGSVNSGVSETERHHDALRLEGRRFVSRCRRGRRGQLGCRVVLSRIPSSAAENIKDHIAFWRGVEVQP